MLNHKHTVSSVMVVAVMAAVVMVVVVVMTKCMADITKFVQYKLETLHLFKGRIQRKSKELLNVTVARITPHKLESTFQFYDN